MRYALCGCQVVPASSLQKMAQVPRGTILSSLLRHFSARASQDRPKTLLLLYRCNWQKTYLLINKRKQQCKQTAPTTAHSNNVKKASSAA